MADTRLLRNRIGAALVLATIVLAGCSVSGGEGTSTTTSRPVATTTSTPTTTSIPLCDTSLAVEVLDTAASAARLADVAEPWTTDTSDSAYAEAVVQPQGFAAALGLQCSLRVVKGVGSGFERLGLIAWTGERMGYVILALDQPSTPYDETVRFDLLFEQPWGEWVAEDVWAVTIESGDTVIVGVNDYFHGPVAKGFLVAFPEPPGASPELPAEVYAITALERAGMANVGIAEPSDTGVGSIVFTTPLGNVMIATVGPVAVFDPFTGYLTGETTVSRVAGVDVQTTLAGPDQLGVADVSFVCGEYGWRIESTIGSPDEPLVVATELIVKLDCQG
ncbi:MAG: hypothetical protein PVG83_02000 [Acidimicrobiia bacterium]|jgi:hypothetical protein